MVLITSWLFSVGIWLGLVGYWRWKFIRYDDLDVVIVIFAVDLFLGSEWRILYLKTRKHVMVSIIANSVNENDITSGTPLLLL